MAKIGHISVSVFACMTLLKSLLLLGFLIFFMKFSDYNLYVYNKVAPLFNIYVNFDFIFPQKKLASKIQRNWFCFFNLAANFFVRSPII